MAQPSLGVTRKSVYLEAYQGFGETCTNADQLIKRLAFMAANSVSACKKKYPYRVNPTSITNTVHPRQLALLDYCLWLVEFCENINDAVAGMIDRGGIEQSWSFYKKRKMLGCRATKNKISFFIHRAVSFWYTVVLDIPVSQTFGCSGHIEVLLSGSARGRVASSGGCKDVI